MNLKQHNSSHYTGPPLSATTDVKNWRILLEQRFTALMPLMMATNAFDLGKRIQKMLEFVSAMLPTLSLYHSIKSRIMEKWWSQLF